MTRALLTFLEDNHLLARPVRVGNDVPLDLVIRDTDLTEEGVKVLDIGMLSWYMECDRIPIPIEAVTGMRVPTSETIPVKSLVKALKGSGRKAKKRKSHRRIPESHLNGSLRPKASLDDEFIKSDVPRATQAVPKTG
jgi:hypothetical protein